MSFIWNGIELAQTNKIEVNTKSAVPCLRYFTTCTLWGCSTSFRLYGALSQEIKLSTASKSYESFVRMLSAINFYWTTSLFWETLIWSYFFSLITVCWLRINWSYQLKWSVFLYTHYNLLLTSLSTNLFMCAK